MNDLVDLKGPWSPIKRAPMLRFTVPLLVGVVIGLFLPLSLRHAAWALAVQTVLTIVLLFLPTAMKDRWRRGLAICIWSIVFGLVWTSLRRPGSTADHLVHTTDLKGPWVLRVEHVNGVKEHLIRADVAVLAQVVGDSLQPRDGLAMVTLMRGAEAQHVLAGDVVVVDAPVEVIDRTSDPGGFDRKAWAATRGISHELFAGAADWRVVGHQAKWTMLFTDMRDGIARWLAGSDLEVPERALVKALVLGQRDELDGDQRGAFVRSGTIHVLAVSGMHVGLIYAILTFMAGAGGERTKARWLRGLLILLALWCYAGLTGASPSVLRATVMFSLFTLSNMLSQRTEHLNSLFAAALVLVLWEPTMLLQASFQLSFLAVLGIILFYKPLESLWSTDSWLLAKVWSLAIVSIAAQLFTTPLSLYLFKAFPVWFLPANIVVVTAAGFAVYGGVALIALYKIPVIGALLTLAMTILLKFVGITTSFFAHLPLAYPALRVDGVQAILLYVLVSVVGLWLICGWKWMRPVALVGCLVFLSTWINGMNERDHQASFTVYDTRDQLCASLVEGRQWTVLTSEEEVANEPYLRSRIQCHQAAEGLEEPALLPQAALMDTLLVEAGPSLAAHGLWRSEHFAVAILDKHLDVGPRPDGSLYDVLIVTGITWVGAEDMERIASLTQRVVLAPDLKWNVRNKLNEFCTARKLAIHDIRESGAFRLEG